MNKARPLLKWAGGKTQLLPEISARIPFNIGTYYEPFIGGGALFFYLQPEKAVLGDFNPELVNLYTQVRDNPSELILNLSSLTTRNTAEDFQQIRSTIEDDPSKMAARTIYLNKTCFNGLYRLNKSGGFNVPYGHNKQRGKILDEPNILACSQVLQKTSIVHQDFEVTVAEAKEGDFVYFDPPYIPLNSTSFFTSYTKEGFGLKEQQRLATLCQTLHEKGVRFMVSNSDTPLTRSLYEGFIIDTVQAKRSINSKGGSRGKISEVLVTNYELAYSISGS